MESRNQILLIGNNHDSENITLFDIDEYINVLRNFKNFLPIDCEINYFDKITNNLHNSKGRIVRIENDVFLEILCNDKTTI